MSKGYKYYKKIMLLSKQLSFVEEEKKNGRLNEAEYQAQLFKILTDLKAEVKTSEDVRFSDLLNTLIHEVQLSIN